MGKTDITAIQNKGSGHPQSPEHENHQMGASALNVSNPWTRPRPGPHGLEEIFKAMHI